IETGAGQLEAEVDANGICHVTKLTCALWGGMVTVVPFAFDPAAMRVDLTIVVDAVDVGEVARYVPEFFSFGSGRLGGTLRLSWSETEGLQPGKGRLQVMPGETAVVGLAAEPGFLSAQVPARVETLPAWLGPLARMAAV